MLCTSALLLLTLLTLNDGSDARRILPSGMSPELFPVGFFESPDFDDNAPFCLPEKEPCGFYSFSLQGKTTPFKWIRSWCKCDAEHECVYDRMDQRMRLYRQTCIPKERTVPRYALQPHKSYRSQSHKPRRHVVERLYRY